MTTIIFDIICEKDGVLSKITYDLQNGYYYRKCIIDKLKETNQKNIVCMTYHFPNTPSIIVPIKKYIIQNINDNL